MKIAVTAILVVIASCTAVFAADVIPLPSKNGNVTFEHKRHQEMLKDCRFCHAKGGGRIEGFGKDLAHRTCKGCHEQKRQGPTRCYDCHKK